MEYVSFPVVFIIMMLKLEPVRVTMIAPTSMTQIYFIGIISWQSMLQKTFCVIKHCEGLLTV